MSDNKEKSGNVPAGVAMHFMATVELESTMKLIAGELGRPIMICLRPTNGVETFLRTDMIGSDKKSSRCEEGVAFYALSKTTNDSVHFSNAKRGGTAEKRKDYDGITCCIRTTGKEISFGGVNSEVFISFATLGHDASSVGKASLQECLEEVINDLNSRFAEYVE
jgi:hypothetical protein